MENHKQSGRDLKWNIVPWERQKIIEKNNRPRCYCGCSGSLSGAPSSWWMRAPLCQSCALVEQVFISLFSLSACLALCGPVTDEPSHREEHQVCSHWRWPPKALTRYKSQKSEFIYLEIQRRENFLETFWGSGECVKENIRSHLLCSSLCIRPIIVFLSWWLNSWYPLIPSN